MGRTSKKPFQPPNDLTDEYIYTKLSKDYHKQQELQDRAPGISAHREQAGIEGDKRTSKGHRTTWNSRSFCGDTLLVRLRLLRVSFRSSVPTTASTDRLTFWAIGAKSERALILRTRVLGDIGDTRGDCSPEPSTSELSSSAARATAKALMWLHGASYQHCSERPPSCRTLH